MWWKRAQFEFGDISDFSDRNDQNERIRKLEEFSERLIYASKLVYQTSRGAREVVSSIRTSKTLSSFPSVIDVLSKADVVAMDSPVKFRELCLAAAEAIRQRIVILKTKREDFSENTMSEKLKNLFRD